MALRINRTIMRAEPNIKQLVEALAPHGVIAGGAARDVFFGTHEAEDIDVFCTDVHTEAEVERKLSVMGYNVYDTTYNATTYRRGDELPVQVIFPQVDYVGRQRYGNYMQIMERFDFTCNQFALLPDNDPELVEVAWTHVSRAAAKDKVVASVFDADPIDHMGRLMKYHAKGYKVGRSQIIQQFLNWQALTDEQREKFVDHHTDYATQYGSYA